MTFRPVLQLADGLGEGGDGLLFAGRIVRGRMAVGGEGTLFPGEGLVERFEHRDAVFGQGRGDQ